MLQTLATVVALAVLGSCTLHETHRRCQTTAECGSGEECYLKYCIGHQPGDLTAAPRPTDDPAQGAADAAQPAPEVTACEAGSTQAQALEGACCAAIAACYDGPNETLGVGPCKAGLRSCIDGTFGACSESILPGSESCENQGTDDDCNGEVDDIAGRGEACTPSSGFGPCSGEGHWDCVKDMDSLACVLTGSPDSELCNDQDEDCDGQIDEDFDISTDRANCGRCGEACDAGELCCGGVCLGTVAASANGCPSCGSEQPCAETASCCGGACRDLKHDRRHCGACGHSCEQAQRCCEGTCKTSCN